MRKISLCVNIIAHKASAGLVSLVGSSLCVLPCWSLSVLVSLVILVFLSTALVFGIFAVDMAIFVNLELLDAP